jgi:proliferating cell nuclear antigen PCNA
MKLQITEMDKAVEWIELFKFMKQLNQYVTFMCKEDELYIQLMDDSHICLIDIVIPSTWFSSYTSESQTFSVMATVLVKIFNMYTVNTIIEIETTDEKLRIDFSGDPNPKNKKFDLSKKVFEINLLDIEKDVLSPTMPDTKLDFVMKTKTFDKYINELAAFGDEVALSCKDEKIFMQSKGDEGSLSIEIEGDHLEEFSVVEGYNMESRYCLKYLHYISKLHIYPNVHIYADDRSPIVITFDNSTIKIKYFLAPKCDDTE